MSLILGSVVLGCALLLWPARTDLPRLHTLRQHGRLGTHGQTPPRPRKGRLGTKWGEQSAPLVGFVMALVLALLGAGPLTLAGGAAAFAAVVALRRRSAHRTQHLRDEHALSLTRLLRAELEAGASPGEGLARAVSSLPAADEPHLREALAAARAGGDVAAALRAADGPNPWQPLAAAWGVCERTGAPMAAVLERVEEDQISRISGRESVSAALAGVRSCAVLLAGLPILGALLGAGMGADPGRFLLTDTAGRWVGTVGVVLEIAGLAWTAKLTDRVLR